MNLFQPQQSSPLAQASVLPDFADAVRSVRGVPLSARALDVLQVNLGYRCNLSCSHCHVGAGPGRQEMMEQSMVEQVLRVLCDNPIPVLDITGGAPELNPHFRMLVTLARAAKKHVIVRTNLTVLLEQGNQDLPRFFRDHQVELIASMPCYLEPNVDGARGSGVYAKSIEALRRLNNVGYGRDEALTLGLVYNPAGPFLPPRQSSLEADYKRELLARSGIYFSRLYVFTNMAIGRFRDALAKRGELEQYQALLASSFNPDTVARLMCTSMLSVAWDGTLADCDFNQVLGIPVGPEAHRHIRDYDHRALSERQISVGDHCFGCTAGQGSS